MKHAQMLMLAGVIYVAPHMSQNAGVIAGAIAILIGLVSAIRGE